MKIGALIAAVLPVLVLLLVGFGGPVASASNAQPFHASFSGTFTSPSGSPWINFLSGSDISSLTTHIGKSSLAGTFCASVDCAGTNACIVPGTVVPGIFSGIITSQDDSIRLVVTGTGAVSSTGIYSFSGLYTIVGGTERFSGATGSGIMKVTEVAGGGGYCYQLALPETFSMTLDGTINS